MEHADAAETAMLLDYVRDSQRLSQWKGRHRLPATLAGWLEPRVDEPTDDRGARPFPAVRSELLAVVRRAPLSAVDRVIVETWYGLSAYPTDLTGGASALDARFASRTGWPSQPLSARSVQDRRARAVALIAPYVDRRPAESDVDYDALGPAWRQPWCMPLEAKQLETAFTLARDRAAIDASGAGSQSDLLHAQLDELASRIAGRNTTVAQRLARVNVALMIALWDVIGLGRQSPTRLPLAPTRKAAPLRTAVPRPLVALAPAGAASLLRGNHDDDSLVAAVDSVTHRSVPPEVAWPILEVCLSALRDPLTRGAATSVHVLFRTIRYARASEDWRVIALAHWLVADYPSSTFALHARVDASVVAGAHRQFPLALAELSDATRLLDVVVWPAGRDARVERAEWAYQLKLARAAVLRRAAEDAVVRGRRDSWSAQGIELAEDCLDDAKAIPGFNGRTSSAGDADAGYIALAWLRRAEFDLVRAHQLKLDAASSSAVSTLLARVRLRVQESAPLRGASRSADVATLSAKLELGVAVVLGSEARAEAASLRLSALRWPLERSTMAVLLAMHEQDAGRQHSGLTPSMRRAARAALAVKPASDVDEPRVSGARRRNQYLD